MPFPSHEWNIVLSILGEWLIHLSLWLHYLTLSTLISCVQLSCQNRCLSLSLSLFFRCFLDVWTIWTCYFGIWPWQFCTGGQLWALWVLDSWGAVIGGEVFNVLVIIGTARQPQRVVKMIFYRKDWKGQRPLRTCGWWILCSFFCGGLSPFSMRIHKNKFMVSCESIHAPVSVMTVMALGQLVTW